MSSVGMIGLVYFACIPCAGRVHFQQRHSVLGTLKKRVDSMTLARSTSDNPLQKRQRVKAYRALEETDHWELNRTNTKSLTRLLLRR